jgi:hypothetical protein
MSERDEGQDKKVEVGAALAALLGLKAPDFGYSKEGPGSSKLKDLPVSQLDKHVKDEARSKRLSTPVTPAIEGDGSARKSGYVRHHINMQSGQSDKSLNERSKFARKEYHRLKSEPIKTYNPATGEWDMDADNATTNRYRKRYRKEYQRAESELENRGFEKVKKNPKMIKPHSRPHHYKRGVKTLRSIAPWLGILGLAVSDDVSADIKDMIDPLGSSKIGIDPAFEDPDSQEYKQRIELHRRKQIKPGK